MLRSMFSTTTMASSTTMPMASTMPNNVSMLMEKPKAAMTAKVPMSETGIATIGISAVRQDCRKTRTTRTTSSRSEEHTSELQSLMRISYAVFCLKKKKTNTEATRSRQRLTENQNETNTLQ